MKYPRILKEKLKLMLFDGRAIVLVGARRTGKTSLINNLLSQCPKEAIVEFNGDDPREVDLLTNRGLEELKALIGDKKIIFIDEAQKIPNIGNVAKLLVDNLGKSKQVILTGSSTFNLLDSTSEPLTGRKWLFSLFPLSLEEIERVEGRKKIATKLELILTYGLYPEVYGAESKNKKEKILAELTKSYLYKDIFEFQRVKTPQLLRDLTKALALQIGQEVSYGELASLVGINKATVINYIDLLEKNFIVFRLPAFSRNQRREIARSQKIFFYDIGIRNAILGDFRELEWRTDKGNLWENFLIAERIKWLNYHEKKVRSYFWRTYDGAEIDYVEEYPDKLVGVEIKYSAKKAQTKPSKKWLSYPQSSYQVIHHGNFWSWVVDDQVGGGSGRKVEEK